MGKFKVRYYSDNEYEVWNTNAEISEFQGSLSDCEAWIRLHEQGYMS